MNSSSKGFSLIEVLVGLAIGLLGMLVMMQVFSVAEQGKRSTSGGDDAQTTGAISLYSILRDVRQAGYGITNIRLIGCNVTLPSGVVLNSMAPVTINHASIPAGDANTDTLLVFSGNGNNSIEGDSITSQPVVAPYTYPRAYALASPTSFAVGDQVIAQVASTGQFTSPFTICNVRMEPILTKPVNTPNVTVATGLANASNGYLYNMGVNPRIAAYAVRSGALTVCNFMVSNCTSAGLINDTTVWVPIADAVVSMRAVYGRDANPAVMDAIVDTYDQATPAGNVATTACGFSRILTLRLALVTRNNNYEKAEVTAAAPAWNGGNVAPITLSALNEWTHYRYKLFQTEVPLRNLIANGVVPAINGTPPC
jgi:type IV pilus assembly protein PilW